MAKKRKPVSSPASRRERQFHAFCRRTFRGVPKDGMLLGSAYEIYQSIYAPKAGTCQFQPGARGGYPIEVHDTYDYDDGDYGP